TLNPFSSAALRVSEESKNLPPCNYTAPRKQRRYHIEYFLLPDDLEPRKLDLVVSGAVAKLFTESDTEAIAPWVENDKMWISWSHSVDIGVTNEYLIKLRDHKTILQIWDTKGKASSKTKLRKQNISSLEVQLCLPSTGRRGSGRKGNIDSPVENPDTVSLQLDLMPLLAGTVHGSSSAGSAILDAYVTFTVETPLLSERQRRELNPLVIRINSATCLPNTPVPIEVLQRLCIPTYCKYKFHNFPPHQTHGQVHGTHVYFKDINVLLTGTMKPGELQRCLRGPPLEIEVHDRDRNMENNIIKPCLFGEDEADEHVGKVSFLACKSTICNSSTKNQAWHPHGVAKVSLTDLLLDKKHLTISAAIRSCSAPDTAAFGEEDKKKTVTASVSSSSPLPMGDYLESDSLLKVSVEIAVPLGMQAESADAQVTNCPYGCIIYIFDCSNSSLLHDLVEEITEINAKALQLDCYPAHSIGMALAASKLQSTLEKLSELDIVTGFHLLDGATHLFVLEGLKDKAIKRLWDRHFERDFNLIYTSPIPFYTKIYGQVQLSFHQRLYTDLGAIFYHFCLCQPLFMITKHPLLYVRGVVPSACSQALSRYGSSRCTGKTLRNETLNQGKVKKPKFEAFRISSVDGKSVFNYSCQSLNSAELAKKCLRWEMAKEPKKRFTYCHEYLSATFDPVDVDAAGEEFLAKSKSMWLSPDGFVFPGFKSSFESNLHPRMPEEKWQENALHANLRPVLSRDRWSWDKRHIDFDLYKKPPEHFMTTAPRTGIALLPH
uniref:Cilia and flagella associated protein 92 (putative) n=1 Tax=Calidris pygmaea TaxID=425635 RepID=A0A8C3K516_9CHAR